MNYKSGQIDSEPEAFTAAEIAELQSMALITDLSLFAKLKIIAIMEGSKKSFQLDRVENFKMARV